MKKLYTMLLLTVLGTLVGHAYSQTYNLTFTGSQLLTVTYKGEVQTITDGQAYEYVLSNSSESLVIAPAKDNVQFVVNAPSYVYGTYTSACTWYGSEYYDATNTYTIDAKEIVEQTLTLTTDVANTFSYSVVNRNTSTTVTEETTMTATEAAVSFMPISGMQLIIKPTDGKKFYKVYCGDSEVSYTSYDNAYYVDLASGPAAVSVTTTYPNESYDITFQYYNYVDYVEVLMADATDVITGATIDGVAAEMANNTVSLPAGKELAIAINTTGYTFKYVQSTDYNTYVNTITDGIVNIGMLDAAKTLKVVVEKKVETVEKKLTLTTDANGKFTYNFYNQRTYTNTTEAASMESASVELSYQYPTAGEELVITPADGGRFYRVRVNDTYNVQPTSQYNYSTGGYTYLYYINVDDSQASNYGGPVEKVEVTTITPADATYNLTFSYYNSKTYTTFEATDVISYATINGTRTELNADGTLTVAAGAEVALAINTDVYAFSSLGSSDNTVNVYSLTDGMASLGKIDCDMSYTIRVSKSVPVTFTLNLDCDPSLVSVSVNYNAVSGLSKGENTLTYEAGTSISVAPVNSELTSILFDGVEQLSQTPYSYTWYGNISEGLQTMTVKAAEIVRDLAFTYYINRQPSDIGSGVGYVSYQFSGASSYSVTPANGYNTINTRDADGAFQVAVSIYSDGAFAHKAFFNDEPADYNYYYSFIPDQGDVVKVFLYTPDEAVPDVYDVTFATIGDVTDATVLKDRTKSVSVANGTVAKAAGYTEWSITTSKPVAIDGVDQTATDGIYTFATSAAATITIGDDSSAIDDINTDAALAAPVYNLQGVRLLDNAQRLNTLPAGVYIVGGKKVSVK